MVHQAGLGEREVVFSFVLDKEMEAVLYAMLNACQNLDAGGYDVAGYFLVAMGRLMACRRPEAAERPSAQQYLSKAILFMEQHYPYHLGIGDVAAHVGIDRTYLYRLFRESYGVSPSEYVNRLRLEKAVELMGDARLSLNSVALAAGFYDYSYFFKQFCKAYCVTPGEYRERQRERNPS